MNFGTPEVLASILILFAAIKLIVILISPRAWLGFAGKVYVKPQITSIVSLLLAAVVLFFLIKAGITIVHIFAVMVFLSLFLVAGIAPYSEKFLGWAMEQDMKAILQQQWLYVLVWVLLMLWCIREILFP